MQADQLIQYFTNYLKELGYSRRSVYQLPHCIKSLSDHNTQPLYHLTGKELQRFYEWLRKRPNLRREGGLSAHYINHHLYAINVFYNWLERTGLLSKNPAGTLDIPRLTGNRRQPLSRETIRSLFAGCREPMETALLHVYYSCGLRRSEGTYLNTTDIRDGLLHVRHGKGGKRRTIPMPPNVNHALKMIRHLPRNAGETALLLNNHGGRISGWSANRLLQQLCERAEIKGSVSLHHLRHSIATHLLEEGLAVEQVRDFLGHSYIETTQYYTKVFTRQLKTND